jgi:hypothetical protein
MGQLKSLRNSWMLLKALVICQKCNFGFLTVQQWKQPTADGSLIYGMMKTEKKLLAFDFTCHGASP